jgi:hypothetical protein
MDRMDEPRRVEVRSVDLDHDRREAVDFGGPDGRRPLPAAVKWLAAVAVLVTFLIVYVNHNGSTSKAEPSPSPSTTTPTFIRPTSTRPVVENLVSPVFAATGWEIFARAGDELIRIQPELGRVTVTVVPVLASTTLAALIVGSKSAIVVSADNVPGYVIPDGKPAALLPPAVHPDGLPIPGPIPDDVWVLNDAQTGLNLVSLTGAKTGRTLTLSGVKATDFGPDGGGFVLAETVHGTYDLRYGGAKEIAAGLVLASNATEWLVSDCRVIVPNCTESVVNRATGARRRIGPIPFTTSFNPGVISPDGRYAATVTISGADGPSSVDLLNLATGAHTLLEQTVDPEATQAMVWSPDSKTLFVADGGIVPVDAATGTTIPFDNPWGPIQQLAIRS